jgi:hypothetical protein
MDGLDSVSISLLLNSERREIGSPQNRYTFAICPNYHYSVLCLLLTRILCTPRVNPPSINNGHSVMIGDDRF